MSISVGREARPNRKKEIKGANGRGKNQTRMGEEVQVFRERSHLGKRRN